MKIFGGDRTPRAIQSLIYLTHVTHN